ncbi:chaperone protein DNAj, putative [Trypanosoma brucei gambiense DAL972]|uniref:Chaperone protein DNAj, putative n=1 Tax=Trypanosoma brucei gambiense (strain MHOM/CI/86/DAL972) TaxID=679716 RepID=D0A720_TRYB9|nr:chaperone protein DNAj, putative [Trypanosoma brucei gambiense DAL972]CBH17471.1 chaperone protein DNAj, putative [Trypanosoma brucei gambiense DAL972]|eukprot:XP_011779735.1 chaperone protein DNAj, putative [Trypanosoma brucei gambiense DAL972]
MQLHLSSISMMCLLLVTLQLSFTPTVTNASIFGQPNDRDLYGLLGVSRGSTKAEIKRAFRTITREHHPDMQEGAEAKEKAKEYMAKVLVAYNILSDDIKRSDYDQFGRIAGERLNAADFTSDELFERFNQHPPILSKSLQLENLIVLRRILNFRGNRLFLLQVYDDTCKSCQLFSSVWENLVHSTLVESGAVVLLRIDAYSDEGPELLKELHASYDKEVKVYGIADGVVWNMPQMAVAVKSNSQRQLDYALMEFVGNFFYDRRAEVNSMGNVEDVQVLLQWLRERRSEGDSVRVLLPPLATNDMGVALSALYEGSALVRSVPRAVLLSLVEEYCAQSVDVLGGDGEPVPLPEFVVASVEQLPNISSDESAGNKSQMRSCRGIVVGAAAALTYRKAVNFLKESFPQRHLGMSGLTHVTSVSFFDICKKHCLLWLRDNCEGEPTGTWLEALRGDYKPFKVGYICLSSEPSLRDAVPLPLGTTGNLLLALVDGDDSKLHVMPDIPDKVNIAQSLSSILAEVGSTTPLQLDAPLSRILSSVPFRMSRNQYLYMCFLWIFGLVYPFFSTCYPFFMMFVTHKLLQRYNLLGNNRNDNNSQTNEQPSGASNTCSRCSGTAPSGSCKSTASVTRGSACDNGTSSKEVISCPIEVYTSADLREAKDGRGFLILIFAENGKTIEPPQCFAKDSRFVFRAVPEDDTLWRQWLSQHVTSTHTGGAEENGLNKGGALHVVAIRRGKMLAAIKSLCASVEAWLFDMADGTIVADLPLPEL